MLTFISKLIETKRKKTRENDVTRLDEHEQVCFPALKEQLEKKQKTSLFSFLVAPLGGKS